MDIPTPGSSAAIIQKCTCPEHENNYGTGIDTGGGKSQYWIASDCPIHTEEFYQ